MAVFEWRLICLFQPPKITIQSAIKEEEEEIEGKSTRKFEVEIFDSQNEKKFDKLVNENKIKSPFKRRLSTEKINSDSSVLNEVKKEASSIDKILFSTKNDGRQNENNPRKKFKGETTSSESSSSTSGSSTNLFVHREFEKDQATLDRRQKQIDYGKNTVGYENYLNSVPR